jgi:beta-lactamase class A
MSRRVTAIVIALVITAGSFFIGTRFGTKEAPQTTVQGGEDYPLLAQRIFLDNPNDVILNFTPLRQQLNTYFTDKKLSGGVYFEYLPTGTSIRISDDSREIAASLMKLPLAMELYKMKELGKVDLTKEVTLQQSWLDSGYGTLYLKGAGYKLTLKEAASIMLKQSDNTALKAIGYSTQGLLSADQSVLASLDVDFKQNPDLTVSISSKAYSSILKCLYFSCYLNREDSEEILETLTDTEFNNRLLGGISDRGIKVAHKIGVASETTQSDCGIVYLPKRNYILCIMLNENNGPSTNEHIAAISKTAYDFLKNAK